MTVSPDLTVPDPEHLESLTAVRVIRAGFADAAARAAAWQPAPCPELTAAALERVAAMERDE